MTALNVSSAVESILEAFTNGMNIFDRLKGRKHRKRAKPSRMSEEELKLQDSLSNRPKEIRTEYSQSVVKHGRRFEKGDEQAYSSLAHTLLVLNTGLINLINNALSSNVVDASKSRQSLLLLSESAAANTMQALSQLNARLSIFNEVVPAIDGKHPGRKSAKQSYSHNMPPRPPPSPLLARGGWVRSKSGSSVVSAASVKRQTVQKSEHNRSKSSPTIPKSATRSQEPQDSVLEQSASPSDRRIHSSRPSPPITEKEWISYAAHPALDVENERPQSMLLVPADYFDSHTETQLYSPPPPIPPKIPLHIRPNGRTRPRPPSAATFMTASTKIGEIPEYRCADLVLSEEEREEIPLPYVIPPPLQPVRPRGRGFKFWKKSRKPEIGAAS